MRLLKLAFISFILLFLLVLGISLFIPSRVRISKAINIAAAEDSILAEIRDAGRWKNWFPGLDSAKPYYEEGVLKGAILKDDDPDHPVYISIDSIAAHRVVARFFPKRFQPVVNVWNTISYTHSDSTTLQWYMDFKLRWYPWEKFASLMLEKSYAPGMEKGLSELKKIVENK